MARRSAWGLMTVLATLVAAYAFAAIVFPGVRSPLVADLFTENALRAVLHLAPGGIAIVAGAFQFNTRVRFGWPHIHRALGRVYAVAALMGGVAGGMLAPSSTGGVAGHFGFGLLAVLWVSSTLLAWTSARARDFTAHRAWMIRSYALCLAAVTLRLYLPLSGAMGIPFEEAYPAIAWLCWVPNLLAAEWLVIPGRWAPLEPAAAQPAPAR